MNFWNESCPWCRSYRSTCWPAVQLRLCYERPLIIKENIFWDHMPSTPCPLTRTNNCLSFSFKMLERKAAVIISPSCRACINVDCLVYNLSYCRFTCYSLYEYAWDYYRCVLFQFLQREREIERGGGGRGWGGKCVCVCERERERERERESEREREREREQEGVRVVVGRNRHMI